MAEKPENGMSQQEKLLEQRKKELLLKKDIAEAEKAIAEANQAKLKAQIPSGEAKPLEGKITVGEKAGYFADLAAYNAMASSADTIASKINSLPLEGEKPAILIVDSLDFCGPDAQLHQVLSQLKLLQGQIEDENEKIKKLLEGAEKKEEHKALLKFAPILPAVPLAAGVLSTASDIVGYFRIDYDIKGRDIKLSDTALRSRVAGGIKKPVYMLAFHRILSSSILDKLNRAIEERAGLKSKMAKLQSQVIDPLAKETDEHKKEANKLEFSEAKAAYERAETLVKAFDEFYKALITVPEGKNYSPLASALIRQHLNEIGITHLLYLAVSSSGGDVVTGRGLFQWGKVGFLSGCAVTYILADCSGRIIDANTLVKPSYVKFKLGQDNLPEF